MSVRVEYSEAKDAYAEVIRPGDDVGVVRDITPGNYCLCIGTNEVAAFEGSWEELKALADKAMAAVVGARPATPIRSGSVIRYRINGGSDVRTCKVTEYHEVWKDGEPGFEGEVLDPLTLEPGSPKKIEVMCWGRASTIIEVVR